MNSEDRAEALDVARRAGIDLDLLAINLELSVKDRWLQHDAALDLALKLQAAREKLNAKLQPTAGTAV